MKLAHCLPLALVAAAALAQEEMPGDTHCTTELAEFEKCVSAQGQDTDEGECIQCLQKETPGDMPDESQMDAAVSTCTASGAPCNGCEAQVSALAECGKVTMREMKMSDEL